MKKNVLRIQKNKVTLLFKNMPQFNLNISKIKQKKLKLKIKTELEQNEFKHIGAIFEYGLFQ